LAKNLGKMKFVLIIFIAASGQMFAQSYRISSTAKKVVSFHLGTSFNRFSSSTFLMKGNYFDVSFDKAQFGALKDKWSVAQYFSSPMKLGIGFNVRKNLQVMVGLDNFKYELQPQVLTVSGSVYPSFDKVGGLSGTYSNTQISMDTIGFRAQMRNIRLISLQINRLVPLVHFKNHSFASVATYGVEFGAIHSDYTLNFGSAFQETLSTLSGIGSAIQLGMRLEFFGRFYLLPSISGGLLMQKNLRMNATEASQKAQQNLWFGQASISVGTTFFPGKKKNCDCPHF
jgi:hypothetical protein